MQYCFDLSLYLAFHTYILLLRTTRLKNRAQKIAIVRTVHECCSTYLARYCFTEGALTTGALVDERLLTAWASFETLFSRFNFLPDQSCTKLSPLSEIRPPLLRLGVGDFRPEATHSLLPRDVLTSRPIILEEGAGDVFVARDDCILSVAIQTLFLDFLSDFFRANSGVALSMFFLRYESLLERERESITVCINRGL